MFRNMFKKTYAKIEPGNEKLDIPEGLWRKCKICKDNSRTIKKASSCDSLMPYII